MPSSPLAWFDALVPKGLSSRRVARAVRFGPHPRHLLDLYAPLPPKGPLPLLLFIQGGGWEAGERREYSFAGRALAGLGFLVAIADYRLVPEVHFPSFVDDSASAASWLVAQAPAYGGSAGRLFLAGHSAGAYNAMMLALEPRRFGGASLEGRIAGVVGLSGPYDFYPFDVRESINAFGRAPDPRATQPINLVTPAAPPMLLAHGERDKTVGDYHTVRLAAKLRAAGVAVTERHYRTLGHEPVVLGLSLPFHRLLPVWRDVAAFLGDRAAETG
ncbi:MAG: alpha/beta hydrolase [Devosia sp.]